MDGIMYVQLDVLTVAGSRITWAHGTFSGRLPSNHLHVVLPPPVLRSASCTLVKPSGSDAVPVNASGLAFGLWCE